MTVPAVASAAARAFLDRAPHGLLIGGESVAAADGREFTTVDPATEEPLATVAFAGPEDVDRAARAARDALDGGWAVLSPSKRGRLLARLADLLEDNLEELAELESLDNGKPVRIAAAADLPQVIDYLRYYAGWPTKIEAETLPVSVPKTFAYTRKEPVGVCGQIIPWNFPLLTAVHKIGPALAAGCTVVLKPAEQTPLTALRLGELALEAGFPAGVLNVLPGDGSTGAAIVRHPGIDKISFTGSTPVGREIGATAGGLLKRVTLELGGKGPNIVLPDADVSAAVRGAYLAGYFNSGQVCQAGSRLFVHEDQFDDVVAALAERAASARLGAGLEPNTHLGPVISAEQHERVWSYIDAGAEGGAELVIGGRDAAHPERGYFVPPTLFVGVTDDMPIAREEIFGPVLVAMPYSDVDEVARRANDTPYGLSAYIWTRDVAQAHGLAARLRAGSVFVNMATAMDPSAPFGGFGDSGVGRESGRASLDAYLETKTVWMSLG
jgi:acyl-CoA reductase-like NAD-dependent aldehyde dehydrogenase